MSPYTTDLLKSVFGAASPSSHDDPALLLVLADSLTDDMGAGASAHRLAAGLRFCARHNVWPRLQGPNAFHGHYVLAGSVPNHHEADAVLALAAGSAQRFSSAAEAVGYLGTVVLALRYREGQG